MALKKFRQAMIDAGRSRKLINKDVNRSYPIADLPGR